jgi:hypothetical protein
VAANAGGLRVLRFGPMRAQLRGIEAVLADGTVVSHLAGLVKDNTGYDYPSLLAGSEGTLAVVTQAADGGVDLAGQAPLADQDQAGMRHFQAVEELSHLRAAARGDRHRGHPVIQPGHLRGRLGRDVAGLREPNSSPVHLVGPAPNGRKEARCAAGAAHRSGSKRYGRGYRSGRRCRM